MNDKLVDYDNPNSLGARLRARRATKLAALIHEVSEARGQVRIVDLGGRRNYWDLLSREYLERHQVQVVIVNHQNELTQDSNDPIFEYINGDACDLAQFEDNSFDIVHSNSVIEHVGSWRKMKEFSREANRLAPYLFIQTPYFWFPVEPHFIKAFYHWWPKPIRVASRMHTRFHNRSLASTLDEAWSRVESEPILLDQRSFRYLYPDCEIVKERFGFLIKSLTAYRGPGTRRGLDQQAS